MAESTFGLTLPIFPTVIFYLCFNLCLTLCFTYFTYVFSYVNLCLTYASMRPINSTCFAFFGCISALELYRDLGFLRGPQAYSPFASYPPFI